jgi:hypothetical protein
MKIQTAILVFACISATAQSDGNFLGVNVGNPAAEKSDRERRKAAAEHNFVPKDPWRAIDGQTNYAKGEGWAAFSGKVLEVQPTGIRVNGSYGIPPDIFPEENRGSGIFFVSGFPYQVAENEIIDGRNKYTAKENGVYTYPTAIGGTSTIRKLDYGIPRDPPEWFIKQQKEQADAAKAAASAAVEAQKKKAFELQKRAVEWLLSDATNHTPLMPNGSASAQRSLGFHYLNGQGVETNKEAAVYWFTQAANQGDIEASNTLTKLKE